MTTYYPRNNLVEIRHHIRSVTSIVSQSRITMRHTIMKIHSYESMFKVLLFVLGGLDQQGGGSEGGSDCETPTHSVLQAAASAVKIAISQWST